MSSWIVADVGGSNIRFACADASGVVDDSIASLSWKATPTLSEALSVYFRDHDIDATLVSKLVIAFAGPAIPIDGHFRFTNVPVSFSQEELATVVPGAEVTIMNDFAAQAYCLLGLEPEDVAPLQDFDGRWPHGNRVIFGPGTGLGVAQLILEGSKPTVVAGEGGNVSFAPPTDELAQLRDRIITEVQRRRPESPDPTMKPRQEDILSGNGLENLHFALHGERRSAEEISTEAHSGDKKAKKTISMFFDLLAGMGADLALTGLPRGGLFISGGMTRRNLDLLDKQRFREIFEARWRYQEILATIPIFVLIKDSSGLEGAAEFAAMQ